MAKVIIITGPSGVGKGTIERELLADSALNLAFSVSATTRGRRSNEIEGQHYFFISAAEFANRLAAGEFLEYSKHFDNYYGTLRSEIARKLAQNQNVLVEVETTGAINIISQYKRANQSDELVTIFIAPPSLRELKARILKRNSETRRSLRKRLKKAKRELKYQIYFQHIVKNDNIREAIAQVRQIILEEC